MTAAADPLAVRLLYTPHDPEPPQTAFLLLGDLGVTEAFYGGAAGGGKSDTLLAGALQYVDVPAYAAILFRRTFTDLNLPGALIPRSKDWLMGSDARWNERDYRWTFPSGASLSFGYMQTSNDKFRYQSAEFQYVGFDELTHFDEADYLFMFTRLRKPSGLADDHPLAHVPLRMRSASNPGGRGHKWVKRRFIDRLPNPDDPQDTPAKARRRIFIPARLEDNPHIDQESYKTNLNVVDPELRAQMLDGDWDAGGTGDVFALYKHGDYRLDHALALGRQLDTMLTDGTLPPPAGGTLALGIDWGEHTGYTLGWPLEGGGMYIPYAGELVAHEPGDAFDHIIDGELHDLARHAWPIIRNRQLPAGAEILELLDDARYDAAGISSMRTFMAKARARRRRLKAIKVSFGAAMPGSSDQRSYKRETIGYLRRMAKRTNTANDQDAADLDLRGVIAIGRQAGELARQAKAIRWADADLGTIAKGDDHAFDALIALTAPVAVRWRGKPADPPRPPAPTDQRAITRRQRP